MEQISRMKSLPLELKIYIYDYLDFVYNTYIICDGKKNKNLILITKPLKYVIGKSVDDIYFITQQEENIYYE